MTTIGLIVSLILILAGKRPKKFGYAYYFCIGAFWGGLELGPVFLVSEPESDRTKAHEYGHGWQNIMLGPLMPFVVCIPSAIRYWLREMKTQTTKKVFALILSIIGIVLGATFFVISLVSPIHFFMWMGIFITVYFSIIMYWLLKVEIPKYETEIPNYDSIWFEGDATKRGTRKINEYCLLSASEDKKDIDKENKK